MLKALLKGGLQAGLGHAPGGTALYRRMAWELLGTQASHVDKLARVLPRYCRVWERACGLRRMTYPGRRPTTWRAGRHEGGTRAILPNAHNLIMRGPSRTWRVPLC